MPTYLTPGVYIQEVSTGARPIQAVGTSTCGFVGEAPKADARRGEAVAVNSWSHFLREFAPEEGGASTPLSSAVYGFFSNGGRRCYVVNTGRNGTLTGSGQKREGLDLLEPVDEIAIVAAPGYSDPGGHDALLSHCEKLKDRVAVLDGPEEFAKIEAFTQVATRAAGSGGGDDAEGGSASGKKQVAGLRPRMTDGGYGALYIPWLTIQDPFDSRAYIDVPPSGFVAGIWARTDATRGVHKAPANEAVRRAVNVTYRITDEEQGELNSNGVNCIRFFAREGIRVWGARTLADPSSEWRYLNVRRLFNMIEESIAQSTRWVVFEPNDATLWRDIRRDVGAFLLRLWRDGALMGRTPEEAFFVQCDAETNPPEVIDAGQVVTVIGVAPVKPAEFIVFKIGQHAGGVEIES
jgi:uncharacterized protein